MYFAETDTLREMERLMQHVPNFPQKGHGIVVLKNGGRIRDDCRFCMHRRGRPPDYSCGYGDSSCIVQRIRCGEASPGEVFRETLYAALSPPFRRRLNQYIKESERNPMDYRNEKHRLMFESAVRKKNRKDYALMSAIYLLTADFMLWQSVRRCVLNNAIRFEEIHLHGLNENSYTLFCAAKDLYLGTDCLTISDLADTSLVLPKEFGLICNGMAVRRFGLGAIHFTERGETK